MVNRLSLSNVINDIEFIFTRATKDTPAKFELPANIEDVIAVSGARDILSVWVTYQFAIPDEYIDDLRYIQTQFISAMKERFRGRLA